MDACDQRRSARRGRATGVAATFQPRIWPKGRRRNKAGNNRRCHGSACCPETEAGFHLFRLQLKPAAGVRFLKRFKSTRLVRLLLSPSPAAHFPLLMFLLSVGRAEIAKPEGSRVRRKSNKFLLG